MPPVPRERIPVTIQTKSLHCTIHVIKIGHSASRANFLTLPELGTDHHICYSNFFECCRHIQPFSSFCIYHIDLPGQCENDPDLDLQMRSLTMADLAQIIEQVRLHCGIER